MKLFRYIGYGIIVFLIGFFITFMTAGLLSQSSGGVLTTDVFNAGIVGLITAILFLTGIIVVCTKAIIDTIKK